MGFPGPKRQKVRVTSQACPTPKAQRNPSGSDREAMSTQQQLSFMLHLLMADTTTRKSTARNTSSTRPGRQGKQQTQEPARIWLTTQSARISPRMNATRYMQKASFCVWLSSAAKPDVQPTPPGPAGCRTRKQHISRGRLLLLGRS